MPPTDSNNPSILKSTREAKGLTLEIVHEATKIPMDALRAIEEGYTVRILSPFYYRGFIKIYAEFLGLNVGETYKQYGLDQAPQPASSATASMAKAIRKEAIPNIFIEQAQESVAFIFKPQTLKLFLKIIGFLILFFVLIKIGGCVAAHMNKKAVKNVKVQKEVEEERNIPVSQFVKQEAIKIPSEDNKVEVVVRAVKNTWIQVKADDHVVFQMTLTKGSMESWSADKDIQISGRDIEQLDMEVNGKQIGSLGNSERRIRKVLITKEGLTVKK